MNNQIFGSKGAAAAMQWYMLFTAYVIIKRAPIYFLNLGYYDETTSDWQTDKTEQKIISSPTSQRQAHLYKKLFRLVCTEPSSCLEIACGLGGGTYLAKKHFPTAKVWGIDINPIAIWRARRHLKEEGLTYRHLDFRNISRLHQLFDLVFLLEASFHFANLEEFFATIWQKLNPHGIFLYGDLFETRQVDSLIEAIQNTGFQLCAADNVSRGVALSIAQQTPASGILQWLEEMMLVRRDLDFRPGSFYHKQLMGGEISYWLFAWKKCC